MPAPLSLVLLAALLGQVPPPPEEAIREVGRVTCTLAGERRTKVELVELSEHVAGAEETWVQRRWRIEAPGAPTIELQDPHFTLACADGAVAITWTGEANERATVKATVSKKGALALEPGLQKRLEQGWSGNGGPELVALNHLLSSLPPPLRPDERLLQLASLVAARQAIRSENFMLAEVLLGEPAPKWNERHTALSAELKGARKRSQPVGAGKPVRLGTKQGAMTVPPLPSADVFWRGTAVCVAQEDRTPPTEMRCYDSRKRKWGPKEPLLIPDAVPGEVVQIGGGESCNFREICWHSALPKPDNPCAGVACDELLAELPGPRLIAADSDGLRAFGARGQEEVKSIQTDVLAKLPGSVLAGGQLYFSGAMLIDGATRGRAWKPFDGVVERAWTALLSPDRRFAVVSASPASPGGPITLWLVPLEWRTLGNELR